MTDNFFSAEADATLVDILRYRALHQRERQACAFLADGEDAVVSITYAQLDQQARAVAAALQQRGLQGERALLLYQPGLEYIAAFFGCLYAGVVAVPAYPPRSARPDRALMRRLRAIAADARPAVALTAAATATMVAALEQEAPELQSIHWLATDELAADLSDQWRMPLLDRATLTFLQYTSGSTALPKGVMLTHGNLLHNSAAIQRCFAHTADSQGVIWLPPYHDMGLIGGIVQPIYSGFPVTLMSPVAFLQRPLRWLEAISRLRATTSGGPNFAYDLCVRKSTPEQRAALDLSTWQVAFNGAEPIRKETLDRFAAAFAPSGFRPEAFYPCYGLAEATLIVSGGQVGARPIELAVDVAALQQSQAIAAAHPERAGYVLVGSGATLPDQTVAIVDHQSGHACAPGVIGEIWVAGPSVAQGYWNRAEQTAETFQARRADDGSGPFLRTGDLGFFQDGELFVTGRLKDLIIIRGRNHYPQDIELTVEQSHPALRPGGGAAFAVEIDGEERLAVVQEIERHYRDQQREEVFAAIQQAVAAQHDLQVAAIVLLKPGYLPKTSSGKIQRHACREGFLAGSLNAVASRALDRAEADEQHPPAPILSRDQLRALSPARRVEELTAALVERIAALIAVQPTQIDPQQPINTLGLDSLMAVELQHVVESSLHVTLPLSSLLDGATLHEVTALLLSQIEHAPPPPALIPAAAPTASDRVPLSQGQRALWFLHQLAPESVAYTIASALRVRSPLDPALLRRAFELLVERHPLLRAAVVIEQGEPQLCIDPRATSAFTHEHAAAWTDATLRERIAAAVNEPFDLERGPLLRIYLFDRPQHEHVLLLLMHHIITDFWSLSVLLDELGSVYRSLHQDQPLTLPAPALEFKDYVEWQNALLAGPEGEQLRRYWQDQLSGELPILNLPLDRPRPLKQRFAGSAHYFWIDQPQTTRLRQLAQGQGATLYTVLLAAFQVLLHRYSGQNDILVGSPAAGRSHASLAAVVGYFVNPIVMRGSLAGDPSFIEFLAQMRQTVLGALAHQDLPFPLIVERLQPVRDPGISPIFQVMFAYEKAHRRTQQDTPLFIVGNKTAPITLGELVVEPLALPTESVQFDLALLIEETRGGLSACMHYNTDLLEATTIARMIGHFEMILAAICAEPTQTVSQIPLLTDQEQTTLAAWNATAADFPSERCLHQLVEEQVSRSPSATAVVFEDQRLSYAELDARANRLAAHLQSLGVRSERLVGVYMERSPELVVALLGILKAGGAYVPLDPSYPQDRIAFMLEHAQAEVLLTQARLMPQLPPHQARTLCLDSDWETIARADVSGLRSSATPDSLAYMIYTSGSTGRPKGVLNQHRGICNRLQWALQAYPLTAQDRVLQKTPFSFDVSVWEFFWPLIAGATLVLARPGGHRDSAYLVGLIAEQQITTIHFVPSMLQVFLEAPDLERCRSLKRVLCSGEALPAELQAHFFARMQATLHNLYGPTEAAVEVTAWDCKPDRARRSVPIGRPIANTQIHLLDPQGRPVPVGVPGELHIGGVQVARGYHRQPQLTAASFIPDPFSHPQGSRPGARLYRTGDLARYASDGTIEFLGRIDYQVKIRGFRIELEEIEAVLQQHPAVRESVVITWEASAGESRLVGYVVTAQTPAPTAADLQLFLKERIPDYMIPAVLINLPALPLNANGKIDRKALPLPVAASSESQSSFVPPATPHEQSLATIWQELLGVDRVGRSDNFFALGGHSLLATQAMYRVREDFQVELPLQTFFEEPTLAGLAASIERLQATHAPALVSRIQPQQSGGKGLDQLLAEVQQLSAEEVKKRLEGGQHD